MANPGIESEVIRILVCWVCHLSIDKSPAYHSVTSNGVGRYTGLSMHAKCLKKANNIQKTGSTLEEIKAIQAFNLLLIEK